MESDIMPTSIPFDITIPVVIVFVYLLVMFLITHIKKDISIGNFTWGGQVMLLTLYSFIKNPILSRHILITILVLLWGIRLSSFMYLRYKKGADPRYVDWQNQKGTWAILFAIIWIFVLNGGFGLVMSAPSLVVNYSLATGLNWFDFAGLILWLVGFYWETVSDYQLYHFMQNPAHKGKIMKRGLWKYSRHPNYFGEICMWWGIYFIALSVPYGWLTIIAPLGITIALLFVTGIPMNEKVMADNPDYQEYKKRTSILIPMMPK